MSKKQATIFWPGLLIILGTSGVLGLRTATTRSTSPFKEPDILTATVPNGLVQQPATSPGNHSARRNLSLQPEALKLGRRLGQRFINSDREVSVITATLISGAKREPIGIQREQNNRGEKVKIAIGNGPPSLSWSDEEGAKSSGIAADDEERLLIEQVVLDSADQFVLAQLRGASYYTVARNVRPTDAGDNYDGPLWNIVRVHDSEKGTSAKPSSNWRLYYINTRSGLIDKIVYEFRGEQVEANFAVWTEQDGETVPSQITWSRNGQVILAFQLISFNRRHPE